MFFFSFFFLINYSQIYSYLELTFVTEFSEIWAIKCPFIEFTMYSRPKSIHIYIHTYIYIYIYICVCVCVCVWPYGVLETSQRNFINHTKKIEFYKKIEIRHWKLFIIYVPRDRLKNIELRAVAVPPHVRAFFKLIFTSDTTM